MMRFKAFYDRVKFSGSPRDTLRELPDEEVVYALAGSAGRQDQYLLNIIATEAANRVRHVSAAATHLAEGVVVVNAAGRVAWLNPRASESLGWSTEDATGRPFAEVFRRVADGGDPLAVLSDEPDAPTREAGDARIRRRDGSEAPLAFVAVPVLREGLRHGAVVTLRDHASERREVEDLLRSREQLEAVLAGVADGVVARDAAGRCVYANAAAIRLLGLEDASDVLASDPRALASRLEARDEGGTPVPWDRLPTQRALAGESPARQMLCVRSPVTGADRWWRVTASCIRDASGDPRLVVTVLHDVTDERQAAEARRRREAAFRAVFDHALDAMLIADDEGRYVDANPAAVEMLGVPKAEILRLRVHDVTDAGMRTEIDAMWQRFIAEGAMRGQVQLVRPDGERRFVDFAAKSEVLPGRHLSILREISAPDGAKSS